MPNSFYPAARKVISNPVVKWVLGIAGGLLLTAITTGIWPFFKGWILTRASTDEVVEVEKRVTVIEHKHVVDYARLDSALSDDTGKLTESEQLQWTIIRVKRLQMRLVAETRSRVGMEARLRMPKPSSEAAKRVSGAVMQKYDKLIRDGEEPASAGKKALEYVFGSEGDE